LRRFATAANWGRRNAQFLTVTPACCAIPYLAFWTLYLESDRMVYLDLIEGPVNTKPRTPEETYGPALRKAQAAFRDLDPRQTALRAETSYEALAPAGGQFQVPFFGMPHHILWPEGSVLRAADREPADIATSIVLLHYLLTADGTPMGSKWIAFRELPGGLGYNAAFQGRANSRLARAFGADLGAFETAAHALGGERLTFGDASFLFRVLPRMWLAVVLHLSDEEFPADANVLFDAAASHYLPTEDLAVLGGIMASRMIKVARSSQ
jgi:hypothetical protein